MMSRKMNVPELRFGEFSGEWEEKKFEDIFIFSTGKNIKQKEASSEFEIPCIRYGELYHMYGEIISKIINRTNLDKSELLFSKGNEILLPSAGENPLDIGSASALIVSNVAIGRTINILRPLTDNSYSQIYVAYYINQILKKKISTLAKGSSISNVYNSDLKKLRINLPCLNEQEKIASFLSSVDSKIEQLNKKKTLLEQYKKGVMQKIFSQELRFKDDDGSEFPEWVEKKLGEVTTITTGSTPSTYESAYYDGEKLFVSPTDMQGNRYIFQTKTTLTELGFSKGRQILKDSVLFVCIGSTIGKIAQVKEKCITNQQINALKSNDENSNNFIYSLLEYKAPRIKLLAGEQAVPQINKTDFSNLKFIIPASLKEQTKIATFLSSLDKKIELTDKELNATKEFKKALLQKMFV